MGKFKNLFKKSKLQPEEKGPVRISSIYQYKTELEKGTKDFDFSSLSMDLEDIQNVNLENLNLDIDLRKVFVPYLGSVLIGKNIITPMLGNNSRYHFLKIQNSRLGGNNVTGDLSYFEENNKRVYIWYSEETFDDKYKESYPQFFISKEAPEELREKYYNPKIIYKDDSKSKIKEIVRQNLTLSEYIKYYDFLKGKYLNNFYISKEDLVHIDIIEKRGLEYYYTLLRHVSVMVDSFKSAAECKEYNINDIQGEEVSLTLKVKFK